MKQEKSKIENNQNEIQDIFYNELGLTREEVEIIESYSRLYAGTIIMGQSHTNVYEDLSTSLETYYKERLEKENYKYNPIKFKNWDDLYSIFNGDDELESDDHAVGTIFVFNHLNKIDNSIEDKLKNTSKDSKLYKALKKLENKYIELKKIIKSRDTIKDLLTKVFENSANYKEQQNLTSKLNENILIEANKINQLFKDIELTNIQDIYGIDDDNPIANKITEVKCFD